VARIGAQTTTGGVVVVANSSTIVSSSALPDAAWIAARIHQDLQDTPYLSLHFPAIIACRTASTRWPNVTVLSTARLHSPIAST
jgi:hypothetical protein